MSSRGSVFLILFAALARSVLAFFLGFRALDDTFITFRYSLNLASGYGFVYNVGERVLGTTTPLWGLILGVFSAVDIPLEHAALSIALMSDAASAFLIFRLLGVLGFGGAIPLAGAMLFLSIFDYLSLARSGMESSFFVFVVLGAIEAMSARRFVIAAVFASLAVLTRPEGALLLAVLPVVLWYCRGGVRKGDVTGVVVAVTAMTVPWVAYAFQTYGSVVPQSITAKAATASDVSLAQFSWNNTALFFIKGQYGGEIFTRTYIQLTPVMTLLAAAGAATLIAGTLRRCPAAITQSAALLAFPGVYMVAMSTSGAFTFYPWYYAPVYPFLAMLIPVGVGVLLRSTGAPVVSVTAILMAAQLAAATLVKLPADKSFWVDGYFKAADDVPREPQVTVAALEIGAVGWRVWPATVLDMVGLVTPEAVAIAPERYMKLKRPDYLIVRTDNAADLLRALAHDQWFGDTYELAAAHRDPFVDREFRTYKKKGEK